MSLRWVLMLYRRAEPGGATRLGECTCVTVSRLASYSRQVPSGQFLVPSLASSASSEMDAWHFKLPGLFLKVFLFKVFHVR